MANPLKKQSQQLLNIVLFSTWQHIVVNHSRREARVLIMPKLKLWILKVAIGSLDLITLSIQCKFIFYLWSIYKIFRISYYATASTDSAAFILGGYIGQETADWRTSIIAEYKNNAWRKIGQLNEMKDSLSVIFHNGEYMIVGGVPYRWVNWFMINNLIS